MISGAYSRLRSISKPLAVAQPRSQRRSYSLEVLLAAAHVLVDRDAEALERRVVAHQPRQVLGRVLARLGREVAEAPVQLDAHVALQLRVGRDRARRARG